MFIISSSGSKVDKCFVQFLAKTDFFTNLFCSPNYFTFLLSIEKTRGGNGLQPEIKIIQTIFLWAILQTRIGYTRENGVRKSKINDFPGENSLIFAKAFLIFLSRRSVEKTAKMAEKRAGTRRDSLLISVGTVALTPPASSPFQNPLLDKREVGGAFRIRGGKVGSIIMSVFFLEDENFVDPKSWVRKMFLNM